VSAPIRSAFILATYILLPGASAMADDLTAETAERFVNLALACVHREYPNKIAHVLNSDADVRPPRDLTPAFYGCYDWHSSVHGHWLLASLARRFPDATFNSPARAALAKSLTPENLRREAEYVDGTGRESFERPYGFAWLFQLAAELQQWSKQGNTPEAKQWAAAMQPLEAAAARRISDWLPKLSHPVRSGEHSNTAFALGLMLDYSRAVNNHGFEQLLETKIREFYLPDRNCPVNYEPSGEDFLSPCLAEADAIRRVVRPKEFASWFEHFLPSIGSLQPAIVADPSDGKLAHLDGLNLSRAWMLEAIADALRPSHAAQAEAVRTAASQHSVAGLKAVTGAHYAGGHWLGSFAVYLLTHRVEDIRK
jgi:hypothetical protein